jgi:hypothetical protein
MTGNNCLGYLFPHLPIGLLPPDIIDTTADKAARADAWPKAVTFIRQLVPRPATFAPVLGGRDEGTWEVEGGG